MSDTCPFSATVLTVRRAAGEAGRMTVPSGAVFRLVGTWGTSLKTLRHGVVRDGLPRIVSLLSHLPRRWVPRSGRAAVARLWSVQMDLENHFCDPAFAGLVAHQEGTF